MSEPIEFRSVTDLEELDALPDDASILVLDNGTAKQISKANAKFGGGSVTKYLLLTEASTQSAQGGVAVQAESKPSYTITHEDGSEVTAQEVYDAFMSGLVILEQGNGTFHEETCVISIEWVGASSAAVEVVGVFADGAESGAIQITIGNLSGGE